MGIILKTTLRYNPDKPYIVVHLQNNNTVDAVALERRYAGWYATLDYTDADGLPRSLRPDKWIRYRNTYILEYNTSNAHYTVKITERTETNEVTVCIFQESINNDEKHTDTYISTE